MKNTIDNIKLRNEEVQAILTKVPNWMIRWGSGIFLFLIVLLLILSWFISYPDIVNAKAILTTEIPPQKIYAQRSGKLEALLVKDNQPIKEGQLLGIIENTANYQDIYTLKAILDTITFDNHNVHFPVDEIPILFLGDVEDAYTTFENQYILYHLNKKLLPYSYEVIANETSLSESRAQLLNLEEQQKLKQQELNLKKNELSRKKTLYEKGVISSQEYDNDQLEYYRTEREMQTFINTISQTKISISNNKKTAIGTKISREKEEAIMYKNVVQAYNNLQKSIRAWELQYALTSDIDGKVILMKYWKTNQNIRQNDLVFTILPKEDIPYIAKLSCPPQNTGKISVGQKVNIKLFNYPDAEYGVLQGNVIKISQVPDEQGNYLIDASVHKDLITSYDKKLPFTQEMSGEASIITEDLKLLDRFFYNFKEITKRQ
ncbi:HlyD family secretion protein [uncultured Dokdonia sp.]|uniref:HlyD family secretion protein n=1 Tax=uncultured Dokdonia sp. TaxID=575653 RepID=UPI0026265451|nr:HlyD family secretion protein [uncultured Dokdonia sp.]